MTAIADINVLLPILFADHAFHPAAWRWWEQQTSASVGLCLLTRLGTLRMLTNADVMGGHPVTPGQALTAWDTLAADPRCAWIDPGGQHDARFRRIITTRPASPNLWTDAWLAALATSEGCGLTSFGADFATFNLPDFERLQS